MRKVNEVPVHKTLGIGSIPLADKVNELTRVINLLLEERGGPSFNWERSPSELDMEKVLRRKEERRARGNEET